MSTEQTPMVTSAKHRTYSGLSVFFQGATLVSVLGLCYAMGGRNQELTQVQKNNETMGATVSKMYDLVVELGKQQAKQGVQIDSLEGWRTWSNQHHQ